MLALQGRVSHDRGGICFSSLFDYTFLLLLVEVLGQHVLQTQENQHLKVIYHTRCLFSIANPIKVDILIFENFCLYCQNIFTFSTQFMKDSSCKWKEKLTYLWTCRFFKVLTYLSRGRWLICHYFVDYVLEHVLNVVADEELV